MQLDPFLQNQNKFVHMPLLILQVLLTLAAASVLVTVTGTELFPLILSSNVLYSPHSSPNKAISRCREPSSNNETDNVGKTGKKNRNLFFITFFSPDEEKRFLLAFLTGDKPFVTFFIVVLVDADLNFLLTELEFWMDFSMESACFCQIRSVNFEQREFL